MWITLFEIAFLLLTSPWVILWVRSVHTMVGGLLVFTQSGWQYQNLKSVGNILWRPFKDLWNSDKFNNIKKKRVPAPSILYYVRGIYQTHNIKRCILLNRIALILYFFHRMRIWLRTIYAWDKYIILNINCTILIIIFMILKKRPILKLLSRLKTRNTVMVHKVCYKVSQSKMQIWWE